MRLEVRAALCGSVALSTFAVDPAIAQVTASSAAQPAEPAPRAEGSDIIVTARRVEERLQDVPISITVFNQQQLQDRNVVNAQDLATYTPSLSANANFGSENTTFAIRGFVQDVGTPPSVGVYFADVVAPRGAAQGTTAGDGAGPGSFFDLQNVQVLKGPQGTLFGRNTTGGAILLVPQRPTSRLGGYVEGSYGNYDMRRVQGVLNVPLGEQARFRIAVDDQRRDGYLRNRSGIGPRAYNDVNYTAVRASLVVDLTPQLENYTVASVSTSDTNGSVQKLIACAPQIGFGAAFACPQVASQADDGFYGVRTNMPNPASKLDTWQVINTTRWEATDEITVRNIVSYAELSNFQRSPLFGTNWSLGIPALGIPTQQLAFAWINPLPNGKTSDQSTFTEELRIEGSSANGKLTYQSGAYLEVSKPLGIVGAQSPVLIACPDPSALRCIDVIGIGASAQSGFQVPVNVGAVNLTAGQTSFRNVGLYTQATYALTEALKLTGGFRYTWDRQSNTSTRISYVFPVVPPFTSAPAAFCTDVGATDCTATLRQKSDKPTWLLGLDFKPGEDILLYAKYARGYRAGGVFPNSPAEYRVFDPEKVESYEVGAKTSFRGAVSGNFNITGFYNDFSNQQLQASFDPAPGRPVAQTTGIVNAGRSRIWGVEVEASISPVRGLRFDGSYAYLNTQVRSIAPIAIRDPNYVVNNQIEKGNTLFLSPKNKLTVTADYTLPLADSIGRVSFGATYTHADRQRTTYLYNNPALVTAYGGALGIVGSRDLLNLNLNWQSVAGLPVDFSLFATNVTKEKYYAFVPGLGSAGFEVAVLGEPRMYGARLRYRFGD